VFPPAWSEEAVEIRNVAKHWQSIQQAELVSKAVRYSRTEFQTTFKQRRSTQRVYSVRLGEVEEANNASR
jgi:hypothetical protein